MDIIVNYLKVDDIKINFIRMQTVVNRFTDISFATMLMRNLYDIDSGDFNGSLDLDKIVINNGTVVSNRSGLIVNHLNDLLEEIKDQQSYLEGA